MMVIDHYMQSGQMIEAPVFTEGMISEASAIHESYPEYLARELRQKILETDNNPFDSEYFTNIEHSDAREEPMREKLTVHHTCHVRHAGGRPRAGIL